MSIPHYHLSIDKKGMKKLKKDKWSDQLVPAVLQVDQTNYEVKTTYRGAHTRKFKKKSYMVEFNDTNLFHQQKTLHLNAEFNDYSLLRSKLSFNLFHKLNVLTPKAEHIMLTHNNLFSSIYLKLDSIDEFYLNNHNLPDGPIYYAQNDDANFSLLRPDDYKPKKSLLDGYMRKYGLESDDHSVEILLYKINTLSQDKFITEINNLIDVEKYLSWLIGVVCTQNFDAFIQNYALYQNRETNRFEVIPWDYDATWGRDINGRIMEHDYIPISGYNTLTARLLACPTFRTRYRLKLEQTIETFFTTKELEKEINELHQILRPYAINDTFLKNKLSYFDSEPEFILQYIRDRVNFIKKELTDF